MKRFFTLLLSFAGLTTAFGQTSYCQVSVDNPCETSYITGVSFANISITDGLCDVDDLGAPPDEGYSDYSSQVAYLDPTVPTLLTVELNGLFTDAIIAYVDWDGSGTWEVDEYIPLTGESTGTNAFTAVLTPPTDAVLDVVIVGGIRIQSEWLTPNTGPCTNNLYGEVEDYSFIVTSAPPASTPGTYCAASGPADCSTGFVEINEVVFEAFSNASLTCPNGTGVSYADYTNLKVDYTLGSDVIVDVTMDGALGSETVDIYIDWNKDGDFDETGETFPGVTVVGLATVVITGTVVPAGTTQGETLMRIRAYDSAFDPGTGPCGATSDGEVEDYTLKILDPDAPKCAALLSPIDGAIDVCSETSLVWNTAENAQLYEVLLTYANGDTAQIINVNDTTYYVGNILLPDSTYTWSITSKDTLGGESLDCSSFTFTTTPFASPTFNFASDTISYCEGLGTTLMPNVSNGNGTILYDWSGDAELLDDFQSATPFFTDTIEGVFQLYVQVIDSLNCFAFDSVAVEVYDAPELTSFDFTSLNICPGDSVGVQVETSNPIKFFDLYNGSYTELMPSSIASSVIYFNAVDTSYIFNAVVNTAMCNDTILMDTVTFFAAVGQPIIIAELPAVGPCEGDSVLLISSFTSDIVWIDGSTNDSLYVKTNRKEAVEFAYGNGACSITSDTIEVMIDTYPFVPFLTADKSAFCDGDSAIVSHNYVGDFVWSNGEMVKTAFAVFVTDSFSVKAISPLGCETESDTIYLTANSNPLKPVYSVTGIVNQLCDGEPVTISTEDSNDLLWSTGESTTAIIVDVDSDIWLKATNQFGCSTNSDTVALTFGEQPARPEVLQIKGSPIDSLTCSVAGASYQWFYESQPMTYTVRTIPLENAGLYRVNVTTANGCVSELSTGFSNVGIVEAAEAGIKVFNNQANWNIVSEKDVLEFTLLDVTGKILMTEKNSNTLRVSKAISNSILILKVKTSEGLFTVKLK